MIDLAIFAIEAIMSKSSNGGGDMGDRLSNFCDRSNSAEIGHRQ